jgi:hypothetical protein
MLWGKLNELLQIHAMGRIIGSLIFAGLQLKQSQDIAIASQYQAHLGSAITAKGNIIQSRFLMAVIEKVRNSEPLDQFDIIILDANVSHFCDIYEANHFQYVRGFVSEEHWQSVLREMEYTTGGFHKAEFRARNRVGYRRSFAEIVDTIIEKRRNDLNPQ